MDEALDREEEAVVGTGGYPGRYPGSRVLSIETGTRDEPILPGIFHGYFL